MLSLSGFVQLVQRNLSVVPINEALIKSGYKPSFVVPFSTITHLFGLQYFLKKKELIGYSKCNHNVCLDTT